VSVNLIETADSRQFTIDAAGARGAWRYVGIVKGEANPEAALELAVRNAAPYFWEGLARQSITADPHGGGVYTVEVPYGLERANTAAQDPTQTPDPVTGGPGGGPPSGTPTGPTSDDDPVGSEVTLELGDSPPKLLTSLATLSSGGFGVPAPPGAVVAAPDYQRAINVGQDGKAEGVELGDTGSVMTITHRYDSMSYKLFRLIAGMWWKTNDATWKRFPRRELALIGCTLKTGAGGRWDATFRFGVKLTTTIAAGKLRDDGTNKLPQAAVTFRGWDYLWVKYEDEVDGTANRLLPRPKAYYVEQVLEEADFTTLGIGG
jgi:hypothetical protein